MQVTVIADLPDSLQPKTLLLDKVSKPLRVMVPKTSGGSYSVTNSKGEIHTINLEPPVSQGLAVLLNEKGEPVKNKEGNSFIMGDGGISNFINFTPITDLPWML